MNNVKTSSANVEVVNSELRLTLSDATTGALISSNPYDYVAGHTGYEFTHGFVEARVWFPGNADGTLFNWSAFWTNCQRWPAGGEIDIAEISGWTGGTKQLMHNYHYEEFGGHQQLGTTPAGNWANAWHVFGVHRKSDVDEIYWDGQLVGSFTAKDGGAPQYLMFNVGTSSSADQQFGPTGQLRVDWVKHWTQA